MIFIFFYMTLFTVTLISDTILTFFEIWILKTSYEVENFKYVKLLKFLEICSVIIFFYNKTFNIFNRNSNYYFCNFMLYNTNL